MLANVYYQDDVFRFKIDDANDVIQKVLLAGQFYDAEFLFDLRNFIPKNGNIIDIGANIGNHSIYFSKLCEASRVIPFEINPKTVSLLKHNVELNAANNIDMRYLGIGCARSQGAAKLISSPAANLGATSFSVNKTADSANGFPVDALDNLVGEGNVNFIKIDVEGMEFDVLLGASQIITNSWPLLYLEVWPNNPDLMDIFRWLGRVDKRDSQIS